MNYEWKNARNERGSGLLTACQNLKLLILSLLTLNFSLLSFAVPLSLESTNDYLFVELPTNWTPQIVGLGCGPGDKSAAIRAEDVFFLNEAMLERSFVADSLCHEATTNSTPYKRTVYELATPIPSLAHMLELGNSSTNLFTGTLTSNASGFISAPKEILDDFATSSGIGFSLFMTNFYSSCIPPSSHRYWDFNVDEKFKKYLSGAYPYPMIVRGVCTNLYQDLATNTFVAFIQPTRTGPSGIQRVDRSTTVCQNYALGYNNNDDEFNFEQDVDQEYQSTIPYPFYTDYGMVYHLIASGAKDSYVGLRDKTVRNRGKGTREGVAQRTYSGTFCMTYSDPICSSRVTDVKAVFAALKMDVTETSMRQGSVAEITRSESRRGVYPISFASGPSDPNGCPSCTFTLSGEDVVHMATSLFGERIKSPVELLSKCPDAEYPTNGYSTVFWSADNRELYTIDVSVPYIIAIAEVDFRAKTLERNNQ